MANRVVPSEVKEIIDLPSTVTNTRINAFIGAANLTVTAAVGTSTVLSSAQKKELERWLTAHLIASTIEKQAAEEKAGEASIKYQGQTGKALDSTSYGQMCKVIDTTGALYNLGKKKVQLTAITEFD